MIPNETDIRTDRELLELSRDGDRDAFGELVSRHYRSCLNLATYILRNRTEAEDEVQQALWKAFDHLDQYLGEAEFFIWLLRIVVNECRMLMRSKKRVRSLYIDGSVNTLANRPIELVSSITDPEYEVINREMVDVLRTEIQRIPPLFRQVIVLRDVEERSMLEVANTLGITIPAAKSRLLRARTELRQRIIRRCGANKHMVPLPKTLPAKRVQHPDLAA